MAFTLIEEAFLSVIKTEALITAIVPTTRIYYNKVPENPVFPFINYQVVGVFKELVLNDTVSMSEKTFIVNSFSKSPDEILNLAKLLAKRLHGFRGQSGTFKIERIILENEIDDLYEYDNEVYHTYQSYRVMYQEI